MGNKAKTYVYMGVLLFLTTPFLQTVFHIPQGKLSGVTTERATVNLTAETWFDGSWQEHITALTEDHLGFRPFFVKCKNQLEYLFFNKSLNWMVVGKDKYLHDGEFVKSYRGDDKIAFAEAKSKTQKLKYIQDELERKNIRLIVLLAPSRAKYLRQYIPDEYEIYARSMSNYDQYLFLLNKYHIHTIDYSEWFEQMRDTIRYPLYTKFGIHWSVYGASLATDSLLKYMQNVSGHRWLDIKMGAPVATTEPDEIDIDLVKVTNMFFRQPETFYYVHPQLKQLAAFPKVLFVGDSHLWTMFKSKMMMESLASGSKYLFYNHDCYALDSTRIEYTGTKEKTDPVTDLNTYQYIVLIYSEKQLDDFGSGFIESTYNGTVKQQK